MQYLEKAPKSPQKGAPNNTSTRPSHYYNYAKHNNPMQYSNTTAARNPYATHSKALPEDKTIEDIDNTGTGNTQSLLTILLIGLTVVIILTGGCLGGYFLFRHSKSKPQTAKSKAKDALLDSSEEIASRGSPAQPESYESEEIASHIPKAIEIAQPVQQNTIEVQKTSDITDKILVYQIYFNNVRDQEEFIGYTPQNQLPYNSLLSLEDIAKIFQSNGWTQEKGMMNNELRNGLCEYFEHNLQDIGPHDLSSAERLCSNENSLIVYPHLPLMFYVLSNQHHSPLQLGVALSFKLLIFKINNQLYSLNHDQLQPITPFVGYRRRLIASNLPLESIILEKKQIWTRLPDDYNGKSYTEWEYATSYAHTMQPNIHIAHGIPFEPNIHMHQHYIIHTHQPNMHRVQLSTHQQQYIRHALPQQREIDEQQQFCNAERLNELRFFDLKFTLVINPKDSAAETWHCHYFPHTHRAPQHQQSPRRQMMEQPGASQSGSSGSPERQASVRRADPFAIAESASERQASVRTVESGESGRGSSSLESRESFSSARTGEPLASEESVRAAADKQHGSVTGSQKTAAGESSSLERRESVQAAESGDLAVPRTGESLTQTVVPVSEQSVRAAPADEQEFGDAAPIVRAATTAEFARADETARAEPRQSSVRIAEERPFVGAAAAAAAAPPDVTNYQNDINLNVNWFGNILNNANTRCSRTDYSDGSRTDYSEGDPCRNIIRGERPELQPRTTDDCDCYHACGRQWQASEDGQRLTMLQCPLNTHATDFSATLQYPSTYSEKNSKLLFGERYEQDELGQFIFTHDIPYWPCPLLKATPVVRAGSDDTYTPRRHGSPIARMRTVRAVEMMRAGSASVDRPVRRLAIEADTSRAWSKDNMFMIIASTIFFILIGIQSFYWLSHSF